MINFKGIKIPSIGMGTWHMGSNPATYDQEKATLQEGLKLGDTVIDTAESYGNGDSERLVGDAIQNYSREKLFLISKFTPDHAEPKLMARSLKHSLNRLGTSYLNLYLYHWPGAVPLSQVVSGMENLRKRGLIKHWGVSNFSKAQMQKLISLPGGAHVFANEVCYNVGYRNNDYDLLPWMRNHGIPLIAYSPVAGSGYHNVNPDKNGTLKKIAKHHQATIFQIMLAWAIRGHHTLAIPQTSHVGHLKDNLNAMKLKLTSNDLKLINQTFPKPTHEEPASPFL